MNLLGATAAAEATDDASDGLGISDLPRGRKGAMEEWVRVAVPVRVRVYGRSSIRRRCIYFWAMPAKWRWGFCRLFMATFLHWHCWCSCRCTFRSLESGRRVRKAMILGACYNEDLQRTIVRLTSPPAPDPTATTHSLSFGSCTLSDLDGIRIRCRSPSGLLSHLEFKESR